MKITFDTKCGEKLANLLCEIDAFIEDGSMSVGVIGISEDAAKFCHLFNQGMISEAIEVIFTDKGLGLKYEKEK